MGEHNKLDKKIIAIFLLISLICFCYTCIRFGYSQTQQELRNDFTNDNWLSVNKSVIRNNTINAYELSAISTSLQEDFTNYTESDINNVISINSSTISYAGIAGEIRDNKDAMVYANKIIRKNDEFIHSFDVYIDYVDNNDYTATGGLYGLSNSTDSIRDTGVVNGDSGFYIRFFSKSSSTKWYIELIHYNGGVSVNNRTADNVLDIDTWYYMTIEKTASKYILNIYSDSARTILLHELSLLLSSTGKITYNKQFSLINAGFITGTKNSGGYVKNLNYNEGGYYSTGFLYFKDLLENTTNIATWFLSNHSINSNTLQVAFSNDNITWVMNTTLKDYNDVIYLEPLNFSTCYVRYRFDDGINTPRLYNSSMFYYYDCVSGNNRSWWMVIFYITIPITICLVIIFRKGKHW